MNLLNYLFGFSGRISRGQIWLFIPVALFWLILVQMTARIGLGTARLSDIAKKNGGHATVFSLVSGPRGAILSAALIGLIAILIIVWIAVMVKRLHDRNRGSVWVFVFWLMPLVLVTTGFFIGIKQDELAQPNPMVVLIADTLFPLLASAFGLWGFVELYCLRGTVGENRFGPDPVTLPPPVNPG